MQNDPVVSKASELLRLGLMPSPQEVKDGKVRLKPKSKSSQAADANQRLQDLLSIDISSVAVKEKVASTVA